MTIERWMLNPGSRMSTSELIRNTGDWVRYEAHAAALNRVTAERDARWPTEEIERRDEEIERLHEVLKEIAAAKVTNLAWENPTLAEIQTLAREALKGPIPAKVVATEPQREIDLLAEIRDLLKDQYYCGHGIRGFCPFCLKSDTPG